MNDFQDNIILLLDNLEREIKRLRMEYNRYLANMPDVNLEFAEQKVKELIKTLHRMAFKKYIHKFRFENLVARYNVQKINFNRMLAAQEKKYEELKKKGLITVPLEDAKKVNEELKRDNETKVVIRDLHSEEEKLKRLYQSYKSGMERLNKEVKVPYEVFKKKVFDRFSMVKQKHKNAMLQIRMVKEQNNIKIKTKVVKDEK